MPAHHVQRGAAPSWVDAAIGQALDQSLGDSCIADRGIVAAFANQISGIGERISCLVDLIGWIDKTSFCLFNGGAQERPEVVASNDGRRD
jgi:hypothetical protein